MDAAKAFKAAEEPAVQFAENLTDKLTTTIRSAAELYCELFLSALSLVTRRTAR